MTPQEIVRKLDMERLPEWRSNFSNWILQLQRLNNAGQLAFDWDDKQAGVTTYSCVGFCSEAVTKICGQDNEYSQRFDILRYASPLQAARRLRDLGVTDLVDLHRKLFPEVRVSFARTGDLVALPSAEDYGDSSLAVAVGVADPPFFWVIGPGGLYKGELIPSRNKNQNYKPLSAFSIGWGN